MLCLMPYVCDGKKKVCGTIVLFRCKVARSPISNSMDHIFSFSPKKESRMTVLLRCKVDRSYMPCAMHHISLYVMSYALCVRPPKKSAGTLFCFGVRSKVQGCRITFPFMLCVMMSYVWGPKKGKARRNIVLFWCKVQSARLAHHISPNAICHVLCVRPKKRRAGRLFWFSAFNVMWLTWHWMHQR